jgi:hypothetical protein
MQAQIGAASHNPNCFLARPLRLQRGVQFATKNLGAGAAEVAPEKRGLQQRVFIMSQSREYATSCHIA